MDEELFEVLKTREILDKSKQDFEDQISQAKAFLEVVKLEDKKSPQNAVWLKYLLSQYKKLLKDIEMIDKYLKYRGIDTSKLFTDNETSGKDSEVMQLGE